MQHTNIGQLPHYKTCNCCVNLPADLLFIYYTPYNPNYLQNKMHASAPHVIPLLCGFIIHAQACNISVRFAHTKMQCKHKNRNSSAVGFHVNRDFIIGGQYS